MKKQAIALTLVAFMLVAPALSLASAQNTIHFIPIGGTVTGTAPIITSSPANCILSEQAGPVTADNMYIILVVDETTKNAGGTLTIEQTDVANQSLTAKTHLDIPLSGFTQVTGKFPSTNSIPATDPSDPNTYWPGCASTIQYNISPMQGFLGSQNVYYKYYKISDVLIGGQLAAGHDQDLTMIVSSSGNFKIVVLLMGHNINDESTQLDLCTPVTDTPLITTPEISTLILIPVALGAAAFYIKKKQPVKA